MAGSPSGVPTTGRSGAAKVTIELRRGKRIIKSFTATGKAGKSTFVFNKTVKRAAYTVQVFATDGTLRSAVVSRKLRLGR